MIKNIDHMLNEVCVHLILYIFPSHRPIMQNLKVLKTLQIMLAQLCKKAKERAKGKVNKF